MLTSYLVSKEGQHAGSHVVGMTRLNVVISDLTSSRTGAERPALYFNYNTGYQPTINLTKTFASPQRPLPTLQQYSREGLYYRVLRQFVSFHNVSPLFVVPQNYPPPPLHQNSQITFERPRVVKSALPNVFGVK